MTFVKVSSSLRLLISLLCCHVTIIKRCIYNDDKLLCIVFYIFISTSGLYVQQCGQLTGAAQCDVYKCNAKSNVSSSGVDMKCACAYIG